MLVLMARLQEFILNRSKLLQEKAEKEKEKKALTVEPPDPNKPPEEEKKELKWGWTMDIKKHLFDVAEKQKHIVRLHNAKRELVIKTSGTTEMPRLFEKKEASKLYIELCKLWPAGFRMTNPKLSHAITQMRTKKEKN